MNPAPGISPSPATDAAPGRPPSISGAGRTIGIDVARGLAVLLMMQTHAYDGWVRPTEKAGWAYAASRAIANIPAPLFLLLAGLGLSLGLQSARASNPQPRPPLPTRVGRSLRVVAYGYAVSLLYALIEGQADLRVLLRADILHCIGLSLTACSLLRPATERPARVHTAAMATAVAMAIAASLFAHRCLPHRLPHPILSALAALLYDVPGYTRFPLLPLFAFCAVGMWLGDVVLPRLATAPTGSLLRWAALCAALATACGWATRATVAAIGGALHRGHPAIVWNVADGVARACTVLFLSLWVARLISPQHPALRPLLRLGRASLLAYAFHIPLCYGRLARPFANQLSMAQATGLLLALTAVTYGVIWTRDTLRARLRPDRSAPRAAAPSGPSEPAH